MRRLATGVPAEWPLPDTLSGTELGLLSAPAYFFWLKKRFFRKKLKEENSTVIYGVFQLFYERTKKNIVIKGNSQ